MSSRIPRCLCLESVFGRYPDTTSGIKEVASLSVALGGYPRMGHVRIYYNDRERYAEISTGHRESRHSSKGVNLFHVVGRLLEIHNLI